MVSSGPTSVQRTRSTGRAWWQRLAGRWPWWAGLGLLLSPIVVAVVLSRTQVFHALDSARLPGRWELVEAPRPPDGVCLECLAALTLSAPERADAGGALTLATGSTRWFLTVTLEAGSASAASTPGAAGRPSLTPELAAVEAPARWRVAASLTYGGALMGPVTRLDLPGEGRSPCVHGAWLPDWIDLELHTGHWRGHDRLRVFAGPLAPRSPGLPPRPQPLVYDRR